MIGKLIRILRHPRAIRDALTNAAWMVDGDIAEKAICGLTEGETAALVRWLPDEGTFVEFGTLFGLTAKAVAAAMEESPAQVSARATWRGREPSAWTISSSTPRCW